MNKPKDKKQLCSYIHRVCLQNKLDGYDYCIRHILVDKSAPFKQCTFNHPISNKRCPNAARKTERSGQVYCPWHIKKMFLEQKHQQLHQQLQQNIEEAKVKKEGFNGLLRQLEHYNSNQDPEKRRVNINWVKQDDESITASDYLRSKISEAAVEMLEQESDEETNNPMLEDVLRPDLLDSDSENLDSDQDDPLKHAGIYTAEEVSLILRDKMLKLQSLYIGQFKHLQYLLREKYKKYLQSLQSEKEAQVMTGDTGNLEASNSSYSEEDLQKLRALVKYHRYRGPEALLKDKAREKRRAILEGENYKPKIYAKCIFNKDEQCQNPSLPLSHYCKTHILYDVNQVLFRPCAAPEPPCLNPVISIRRHHTCMLHSDLKQNNPDIDRLVEGFDENFDKPSLQSSVTDCVIDNQDISSPANESQIHFNQLDTTSFSSQDVTFNHTIPADLNTSSQDTLTCENSQNMIQESEITPNFNQSDLQENSVPISTEIEANLGHLNEINPLSSLDPVVRDLFPLETFPESNFNSTLDPNTNPNSNTDPPLISTDNNLNSNSDSNCNSIPTSSPTPTLIPTNLPELTPISTVASDLSPNTNSATI